MKNLGNIIWNFPFFGFVTASIIYCFGLLLAATGVGAPIGLGLMEYGKFYFAPFNREMVSKSQLNEQQSKLWKRFSTVMTIVWFPFGALLWIGAIFQIVACCLSIIGIPVAVVVAKSLGTIINPVNKKCVPAAVKEELERRKGREAVEQHLAIADTQD